MRCAGSLLAVLLLAGCGTTQVVRVPLACAATIPPAPAITADADLATLDDGRLLLTIARERLVLIGHTGELRAVLEACQR
jgi:hypothetical protein